MLELYKNIKKRRLELGMTQSDLAEKLGYSDKSMIAKIENGKVDLAQSRIIAFADALKISPSDLMGWKDDDADSEVYYTNPETAKLAQELFENHDLRILFDAARDSDPKDLQMAADLLKRLKGTDD